MKRLILLCCLGLQTLILGCSPVKLPITDEYKLAAFSNQRFVKQTRHQSIYVSLPQATAGYKTAAMLYMKKPFKIETFAHNAWVDNPASMLLPLILQSLERSGYFYAVISSPHYELTDYRLDTELIELQQNFLKKPSTIDLSVKVALTRVSNNRVIASRLISLHVPCPSDTPYGGVIAANQATRKFTQEATLFVVNQLK